MKYDAFVKLVREKGWTVAQLRCDVRPSQELLDLMEKIELTKYEAFVARYEKESK